MTGSALTRRSSRSTSVPNILGSMMSRIIRSTWLLLSSRSASSPLYAEIISIFALFRKVFSPSWTAKLSSQTRTRGFIVLLRSVVLWGILRRSCRSCKTGDFKCLKIAQFFPNMRLNFLLIFPLPIGNHGAQLKIMEERHEKGKETGARSRSGCDGAPDGCLRRRARSRADGRTDAAGADRGTRSDGLRRRRRRSGQHDRLRGPRRCEDLDRRRRVQRGPRRRAGDAGDVQGRQLRLRSGERKLHPRQRPRQAAEGLRQR